MNDQLEELKEKADILGIQYSKNIGAVKLLEKIDAANAASKEAKEAKAVVKGTKSGGLKKGVKLTDQEIRIAKAKSLSKVKIANLNSQNTGATTVTSGVINQYMSVQRVIPLNMEIALEECLIGEISERTFSASTPEIINGNNTGNFITKEMKEYAVVRL